MENLLSSFSDTEYRSAHSTLDVPKRELDLSFSAPAPYTDRVYGDYPDLYNMSLTFRRRKFAMSIPIRDKRAKLVFDGAKIQLRGVLCWLNIQRELRLYGTNSNLFDAKHAYRRNLGSVLKHKFHEIKEDKKIEPPPLRGVFHPDSKLKQIWNLVVLFLLLYVFSVTPWVIAFEDVAIGSELFWVETTVDFLFLIDIFVTLNSAYWIDDYLEVRRGRILLNYLKGMLLIDIVAVLPFYLLEIDETATRSNSLIRLIRVTKVTRVFRASKVLKVIKSILSSEIMEKFIKFVKSNDGVTRLFTAMYIIVIMAHFTACMWYFIAKIDGFGPDTWVVRHGFQDESRGVLYLASLYWAFTILTTVGFGDIFAFTSGEMILCILWMLFGIGFYSFVVGSLTSVLTSFDAKRAMIKYGMKEAERFADEFYLSKELLKQMKKEIDESVREERMDYSSRVNVLAELPKELRYKVVLSMNGNAASKILIFQQEDMHFINHVVPELKFEIEEDKKLLYKENDHATDIFFLSSGRVNFVFSSKFVVYKTMIGGSYFGEIEVIENVLRLNTTVTEERCEFLKMNRSIFDEIKTQYPSFFKKLKAVAEEKKVRNAQAYQEILDLMESVAIKKECSMKDWAGKKPRRKTIVISPTVNSGFLSSFSEYYPNFGEDQRTLFKIQKEVNEMKKELLSSISHIEKIVKSQQESKHHKLSNT